MKTGAVIVAAGMSSRMHDFKPLLKIGSITIVQRIIATLQQAGVDLIVLVTGYQAETLEKHVSHLGVICLRNKDYATSQMLDSTKIGLSYLQKQCDRIIFTPADVPFFTSNTIISLLRTNTLITAPVYRGREGHPLLLSAKVLEKLLTYSGEQGLRGAIKNSGLVKQQIEVGDEGILFDMDTPEDKDKLLLYHNRQMFRPQLQLRLAKEDVFLGPGAALLLHLIVNTGSVRAACAQMNISYSKGWKIINNMEYQLGYAVVERFHGGTGGGYTQLTDSGKLLLAQYDAFTRESKTAIQDIFDKYSPGF